MWKFCNLGPHAIELLSLFGLHLRSECFYRRRIFFSHHHTWGILGATSVSQWTRSTIRCRSPVGIFDPTFTLICADPFQQFVGWTPKRICWLIVSELVWIKLRLDAALLQRRFVVVFRNWSIQIDPALRHGFDVGVLHRVAGIHQHLLWGFSRIGLNSFDPAH